MNPALFTALLWAVAAMGILYGCLYVNYPRQYLLLPAGLMIIIGYFAGARRRNG